MIESGVNLQGNKTILHYQPRQGVFESGVNLQGNKTPPKGATNDILFESGVNLQGNKTLDGVIRATTYV